MRYLPTNILIILLALTSCNLLGGGGGNPGPKLEDLPGQIVYSAEKGSNSHIFITDQEGTQQLTSAKDAEGHFHATDPSFSPDGQWIIYSANKGSGFGAPAIYMVRADGSERDSLTNENGELIHGENPVFSPDGNRVAFNRAEVYEPAYQNNDIYVVELSNGKVRKLTENTAHDELPTWRPDGSKIAFSSGRNYEDADTRRFRKDLYSINIDGTNLQRLTETGNATRPVWNPNGNSIVFEWNIQGNEVFVYHISSDLISNIETGLKFAGAGIWSSQGTKLLVSGRKTDNAQSELRLLNIDKEPPEMLISENSIGSNYDWYNQ